MKNKSDKREDNVGFFNFVVSGPTGTPAKKLTQEDVWGVYDRDKHKMIGGMIVARGKGENKDICPIFRDIIPYKSVTVVCQEDQVDEVTYWLEYVHGGNSVNGMEKLPEGKVAIRSDYQCW